MGKLRSFVIAPFDAEGQRVGDAVRHTLERNGIDVRELGHTEFGVLSFADAIYQAVVAADFIVADVTRANPNVFYQIGMAHALRKPVILIMSKDARGPVPSSVAGAVFLAYDPSDLSPFTTQLTRAAAQFSELATWR